MLLSFHAKAIVAYWHKCEVPTALSNVRIRGAKRKTFAKRRETGKE
jgi:hypothetical protein